ncbi:hypothetical protein PF002_g24308 [Phytophthora fragariae]|nr:hypothetical protein PF011_g24240 [Phytophthora fragariae]KAE9192070.1 hypothetical protein PF002_g24308 [Phytophthora fragariae]
MAQDIALDLREEAIAAADIDPEDEESVPQEMPSTASEVSGVAQPASATVEADEQRPADRGLQVQPGVEAAPASAPRRAGQKRKQAAKPAVQQGLLDEADDTTDATTRTSRRKKARPARTASNSTQRDGVASRTRARIRLAPYTNEEAAGDRAGRDESPVRAYARAGVLDPESSNEVADQYADTVMEEAPVAEHAAEQPRGMNQQQEDAMTPSRRGEEQPGDVTVQPAPAHVPDEGDEEPRIYPQEKVVEVRRRRYRTRTGRYVLEFEVRKASADGGASRPETIWINHKDYEQLWVDGRLRLGDDDRGADEQQGEGEQDGSQRRSPLAKQRESRTIRC